MADNLNMNQLRVFYAVARLQSFTRASGELNLTQPGISKHIKQLEEYYGTRLFDRMGKKVILTGAGEILLTAATDIFNSLKESKARIDDLRGLSGGKLSIGADISIGTYLLPEILVKFRQKYPNIEVKVDICECLIVIEKILNGGFEIGFVCQHTNERRLVLKEFKADQLILVVSRRHKWARGKTLVDLHELMDEPFLLPKQGSGTRDILDNLLRKADITLTRAMELGNVEGIKKAVEAELGISIISKHVAFRELASGILKSIPIAGMDIQRNLYVIYRKEKYLSQAARAFLTFL